MKRLLLSLLIVVPMQLFGQVDGTNDQNALNQSTDPPAGGELAVRQSTNQSTDPPAGGELAVSQSTNQSINQSTNQHLWFKFGPGIYNDRDDGGLSLYGSLTYQQKYMYKLRYIFSEEFRLFEYPERFNDIGFLFGVSKTNQWTKISAYGGLGIVKGKMRGDFISYGDGGWFSPSEYEWDYFTTLGIPLELEFSLLPHQLLGVGFSITGNINSKNSLLGLTVKLEIGK